MLGDGGHYVALQQRAQRCHHCLHVWTRPTKRLCRQRYAGSDRANWHSSLLQAAQNEQSVIRVAVVASRRLEAHLRTARERVPVPILIDDDEDDVYSF